MDQKLSDLENEIKILKQTLMEQSQLINSIILAIHLSETDIKDHITSFDS